MTKILFAAVIALAATTGFAQKINNKLSFKKGQKLEFVTETVKKSSMEMMGQPMESTVNSSVTEIFDVQDVNNNGATIEHKVKRLVFTMEGMGQTQSFDSEKENDLKGELGKMFEKSLKDKYTMTIDATGKVSTVKADDDNPNASKNEMDGISALMTGQMGLNLGIPKTGDATQFKILPDKEVNQGDTWMDSSSTEATKKIITYTINSITSNEILLDYKEEVTISSKQQIMGTDATINSKEMVTGKIILDKTTGLLKQKTATVDAKGNLEAQGMTLPSSSKTTITITVKPA